MVELLFALDDDACRSRGGAVYLRPDRRDRRDAIRRGRVSPQDEPGNPAQLVRAGLQRRVVRDLQGRHGHQGPGCRQHCPRRHPHRRRLRRQEVRLRPLQPAVGVDWKDQRNYVDDEHTTLASTAVSGPAPPAVSDGAMLFLLHLVSKMRQAEDGGSPHSDRPQRITTVLRRRRRWRVEHPQMLLDNDLIEAIIGLPKDMSPTTLASPPTSGSSPTAKTKPQRLGAAHRRPRDVHQAPQRPRLLNATSSPKDIRDHRRPVRGIRGRRAL